MPRPDNVPEDGFAIHVKRDRVEQRGSGTGKRYRTVGSYKCYMDGQLLSDRFLKGATAEPRGPGDNGESGVKNASRIALGVYQLGTHTGQRYGTFNYSKNGKKPGLLCHGTGERTWILIHPGNKFKSSVGCINLTGSLIDPNDDISYRVSYGRVDHLIHRLKELLGRGFPSSGKKKINAWLVVDGDPIE